MFAHTPYADPRLNADNTSDHTRQAGEFTLVDASEQVVARVSGMTWNLMNYCLSETDHPHGYKNNPWNYTEKPSEYLARKKTQLDQILAGIKQNGQLDFMLLQEIDVLNYAKPLKSKSDQLKLQQLQQYFQSELKKLGWKMVMTKQGEAKKPFAILYNTNTLTPNGTQRGVLDGFGFECQFTLNTAPSQVVSLVDLHLDYSKDYSESIPAFQHAQVKQNIFTVMGGDTNHAPNQQITGLINNWQNITNLSEHNGAITGQGEDGKNKCYDCFLTSPTRKTRVVMTELPGEVFKYDKHDQAYVVAGLDPQREYPEHCTHLSAPGKPWKKGGWKEYQDRLKAKSPAAVPATSRPAVNKMPSSAAAATMDRGGSQPKQTHTAQQTHTPLRRRSSSQELFAAKTPRCSASQECLRTGLFTEPADLRSSHSSKGAHKQPHRTKGNDVLQPQPPHLLADIDAHIKKLNPGVDSFFLGERRRQKIRVLKSAKKLLNGAIDMDAFNKVKLQNPKWANALGKSEVVKLVDRVVNYYNTSHADSGLPRYGKKK